ncbi:MAG: hypothetical protein ACKO7W_10885 [Elainella sp.]
MTQPTNFSILEAPSILGLFPSGVEQLPTAFRQATELLQLLMASPQVIGMNITIFNPELDRDGTIASVFVEALLAGLYPQI